MAIITESPRNGNPPTPPERWAELVETFPWLQSTTPSFGVCESVGTMPAPSTDAELAKLLAAFCRAEIAMAFVEVMAPTLIAMMKRIASEALFDAQCKGGQP